MKTFPTVIETLNLVRLALGPSHQDTIVSMHNLAELYLAAAEHGKDPSNQQLAESLQQEIISIVESNKLLSKQVSEPSTPATATNSVPQGREEPLFKAPTPPPPEVKLYSNATRRRKKTT